MNQPPSSSSFSLDSVADPGDSKSSSSSLTSKLRRRLRASTTTASNSHGDSGSGGGGGGGGGGAVGLTTLRNSKSSTNLLLASLGRKARPSGGGRARANTGSSKASPKTRRTSHESHDAPPSPPPQMLPFDLPPLLIPPTIANIAPSRTAAAQTSKEQKKLARQASAAAGTNDSTRHSHENRLCGDTRSRRDASIEEEVLAAPTGTSDTHDDFDLSVQQNRGTFSKNERSCPMPGPSESDKQPASVAFKNDFPEDRDRSLTRPPSERRGNSSPRRPVPEPLRTRAAWAELPPLRADSDESVISYASIQKSPTRGPMPRRISRKPTSSPSGALAAPSPLETTRPAEGTCAPGQDAQVVNRAAEWTLSPTEVVASPFVGNHHHDALPSPLQAQPRPNTGSTRILTSPSQQDSDQVRRRLQSLQEHISAFLREADSDGRAASVVEVEVLAARLAEAGTVLRGSLRVKGQAAESGSSAESAAE